MKHRMDTACLETVGFPLQIKEKGTRSGIRPQAFISHFQLREFGLLEEMFGQTGQCWLSSALCLPFTHTNSTCAFGATLRTWRHQQVENFLWFASALNIFSVHALRPDTPLKPLCSIPVRYTHETPPPQTHTHNISASNCRSQQDPSRYVYHIDIYAMKDFCFSTAGSRVIESQ